ncbi:GTP-binding protein [Tomitella biformata]|uniref:GTP-binding protein n=1 Tax=Tomitella biformata TaxID=630403 RepID=UPI000463061E|nr:GTP-binding protein [Tomitella biformata]
MRTPVILIAGIADEPMAAATIALQWDLPRAVVVQHRIDVAASTLTRVVSDATGVLEREEIDLAHACVSCAVREDIVPTLERLAGLGRWGAVIACLPVTAEAVQVCRVLGWAPHNFPHTRIAATITALGRATLLQDLLGDDRVDERGLQTSAEDFRGVAEIATAMVEYSDVVLATDGDRAIDGDAAVGVGLLRALVRPGAGVLVDTGHLNAAVLAAGVHVHRAAEEWVAEVRRGPLPPMPDGVWRLDLRSGRPFHPDRLYEQIQTLGGGPHRSRGCFWLPSRHGQICNWEGAGGHLSIGATERWGGAVPLTRLTVVGVEGGGDEIAEAFRSCLLSDVELEDRGRYWEVDEDGFEPWLGAISIDH